LQTEIYTLGYDDPEFARRSQQLNVKGGQDWLLAADSRYRTTLEGFIDDNKSLLVIGLLGVAALVLLKGDFAKPKRRNPKKKRKNSGKRFKIEVYGGPGGTFTSYWGTRKAAAKEHTDIKRMKMGRSRLFEKRGGRWV
jgi:hypothetical protein